MADMFKRTITAHDCTNLVGVMPGRPIFQLDYPDGSVVVKPESGGTPIDFRHVSRVMRIADPESAAVALTNRERASLALLAVRFWCNELAAVMESAPVWQKMNLQTHMCDLREAAEKRAGKDDGVVNKTDVRRFAGTEQREELAGVQIEIDVVDGEHRIEATRDAVQTDHGDGFSHRVASPSDPGAGRAARA